MNIIKPDGTEVEVADDYVLQKGEKVTEEGEGGEGEEKKLNAILDKKIDKIVQAIKDTPQRKVIGVEANIEKSVMETDPYYRKFRPFVQLSKKMEFFVKDVVILARGGVPTSLQKALSEGDDTAGGFTVPEEFNAEVIRYSSEEAVVRPRARVIPMGRDIVRYPKLDQSSDQFAGVELFYAEESELKAASQPKFGKIVLSAKKLIGLCPVTDELLEDSAINIANFLVALFGEALAYKEDKMFLIGTGMAQPLGVINATGINVVSRNTSTKIVLEDIFGMDTALPAWAEAGAVWLMTKAAREQVLFIGNTNTTNKIQLLYPSLQPGIPATMLGKPIVLTDKLPALGSKGDILLGNFAHYLIGDRGVIQVASSIHDRFRYDETTFRFVKRHDGQPAIPKAFVVLSP